MSYLAVHPKSKPRAARRLIVTLAGILVMAVVTGLFAARPTAPSGQMLTLSDYKFTARPDGGRVMSGTVRNNTERTLARENVTVEFVNFDGRVVGSGSRTAPAIPSKQSWTFDLPVSGEDAVRARLMP